jgi:hypothetical protein
MDLNINWRVTDLTRDLLDGYVKKVNYAAEIVYKDDDEVTHSFVRSSELNFDRPETLIPYSDLTNDIVIGWIKGQLGEDNCKFIEDSLTKELNEQKFPTLGFGFPWPSEELDDSVKDDTEDESVDGSEENPNE